LKDLIEHRKANFKAELNNDLISDIAIIRKNLLHGNPLIFHENEEKYFFLKQKVANFFNVSTTKVVMVGSAKLGFSIAPKKLWNDFNDESDIDIVVISEDVFDEYWKELLDFNINTKARSEQEDINYREFLEYFLKGWIRPDLFPFNYPKKNEWFEFFKSISYGKYGNFKIAGAIFRNEYFFESYHSRNINKLRTDDHE
jgi:predicted nucleotidyltransferase